MRRYEKLTAVVTGAGSGIGRATAERLAEEGASVAVVDVDAAAASETVAAIQAAGWDASSWSVDISDRQAFDQMHRAVADLHGPVGLLVNNAAVVGTGTLFDWDDEVAERAFAVNVRAMVHASGSIGRAMCGTGGGAIVNITSIAGIMGLPGVAPYSMTKGAIVALTRSMAMELAPLVRVNAIAPGKVITPFREKSIGPLSDEERSKLEAFYPLQTLGLPEDVAAAVAYLGSADARFVTGVILPVDGGRTAGFHDVTI